MSAMFCELRNAGLISFTGNDASSFLQAQLTSDIVGLGALQTQYSGYCSPKGRLLSTFLLWRVNGDILAQLPAALRPGIQSRLGKYVLRSKVVISDAGVEYTVFALAGSGARDIVCELVGSTPAAHRIAAGDGLYVSSVPGEERYLLLVERAHADTVRSRLTRRSAAADENAWTQLEIEAGIPVITVETQEQYVPQMVNLDLIGGVSYGKGCYPGQEIVARTHYLGRLKQRMYRVRFSTSENPRAGDALFSHEFGPEQASGAILYAAAISGSSHEALAVVQMSSAARGDVHWKALEGPGLEFLPLPYTLPD